MTRTGREHEEIIVEPHPEEPNPGKYPGPNRKPEREAPPERAPRREPARRKREKTPA
jgi:hypothetical protein